MEYGKKQRAMQVDREVRRLVRDIDKLWFRVGRLCERCRSERLYEELGFTRFEDWITEAVGWSRSRAYVGMGAVRNLVPIRDGDLSQITMQNAYLLSRVPMSEQVALVEAAKTQTEREFRKTVETSVPDLHLETMVHVEFWVPSSLAEMIDSCIEKAKALNATNSRNTAVEAIFAEYLLRYDEQEEMDSARPESAR